MFTQYPSEQAAGSGRRRTTVIIRESVTVDKTIAFLNSLLEVDREAVSALMEQRVPCGPDLAAHPTVQVMSEGGLSVVGFLGVLNGLFGTHPSGTRKGWGTVAAIVDDKDKRTILRFERVESPNS